MMKKMYFLSLSQIFKKDFFLMKSKSAQFGMRRVWLIIIIKKEEKKYSDTK